jgi:hypothetical protein
MLTHRQQSFIATLWFGNRPVNTLGTLLGKPAWVNWLGPAVTAPYLVGTIRNDSAMLSCQAGLTHQAMKFYFRHTRSGYNLYVRAPGEHFGKALVAYDDVYLGLMASAVNNPSSLTLCKPNGSPASYADLLTGMNLVGLAFNGRRIGRSRRRNSPFEYLAAKENSTQLWILKVLEHNVPWLSSPNEV